MRFIWKTRLNTGSGTAKYLWVRTVWSADGRTDNTSWRKKSGRIKENRQLGRKLGRFGHFIYSGESDTSTPCFPSCIIQVSNVTPLERQTVHTPEDLSSCSYVTLKWDECKLKQNEKCGKIRQRKSEQICLPSNRRFVSFGSEPDIYQMFPQKYPQICKLFSCKYINKQINK